MNLSLSGAPVTAENKRARRLAQMCLEQRDWPGAIAACRDALRFTTSPEQERRLYLVLCLALRALGRLDDAKAVLAQGAALRSIQTGEHLDYALFAAIAADDLPLVEKLFHQK